MLSTDKMLSSGSLPHSDSHISAESELMVRINGVLPSRTVLGGPEISERSKEVARSGTFTNTSCSLFVKEFKNDGNSKQEIAYHLLFDIGEGVTKSVRKGLSEMELGNIISQKKFGKVTPSTPPSPKSGSPILGSSITPNESLVRKELQQSITYNLDALLITHPHEDHIKDLSPLIKEMLSLPSELIDNNKIKLYCTRECADYVKQQVMADLGNALGSIERAIDFNVIKPNEPFNIGPFSILPVSAFHGENCPAGSVIYIVNVLERKLIIGWDFLSLSDVSENVFWNADLLILGTECYNHHHETGMISVAEAFNLVRSWNAKECYLVHYSGLKDFEEASNQWFRGPVKAMSSDELQQTIDSHLRVSGSGGKFRIQVAKEGMIWTRGVDSKETSEVSSSIGTNLEIEGLEKYVLKVAIDNNTNKLNLVIEDRINRYDLVFENPRIEKSKENRSSTIYAQGEKGMLAKGPDLIIEIASDSMLRIDVFKGKKKIFSDDILLRDKDVNRLKQFINENF